MILFMKGKSRAPERPVLTFSLTPMLLSKRFGCHSRAEKMQKAQVCFHKGITIQLKLLS